VLTTPNCENSLRDSGFAFLWGTRSWRQTSTWRTTMSSLGSWRYQWPRSLLSKKIFLNYDLVCEGKSLEFIMEMENHQSIITACHWRASTATQMFLLDILFGVSPTRNNLWPPTGECVCHQILFKLILPSYSHSYPKMDNRLGNQICDVWLANQVLDHLTNHGQFFGWSFTKIGFI